MIVSRQKSKQNKDTKKKSRSERELARLTKGFYKKPTADIPFTASVPHQIRDKTGSLFSPLLLMV